MTQEVERLQKTVEVLTAVESDMLAGQSENVHMPMEQASAHIAEARRHIDFVLSYSSKVDDLPPAPAAPTDF